MLCSTSPCFDGGRVRIECRRMRWGSWLSNMRIRDSVGVGHRVRVTVRHGWRGMDVRDQSILIYVANTCCCRSIDR